MKSLITVMIPARKRAEKLVATLQSIHASASSDAFETVVRIDDDDREGIALMAKIESFPRTTVRIGPRLGYAELDSGYFAGMEWRSTTPWVWIGGDDMIVTGDWMGELANVPLHGFIVQPEVSKLRQSVYRRAEAQAFPIFPRLCWSKYVSEFPRPFDTVGHEVLVSNGWKTCFLSGVTMWHDRADEDEIMLHRIIN